MAKLAATEIGAARDRPGAAAPRRARASSWAPPSSACTARSARCASTKGRRRCSGSSSDADLLKEEGAMTYTAHVDTFARDHLPPRDSMAGVRLRSARARVSGTDECRGHLARWRARTRLGQSSRGRRTRRYEVDLRRVDCPRQPDRKRADRRSRPCPGQSSAAARPEFARFRRVLVRRGQGRRHRGQLDADAACQGAHRDRAESRDFARALRRPAACGSRCSARGMSDPAPRAEFGAATCPIPSTRTCAGRLPNSRAWIPRPTTRR